MSPTAELLFSAFRQLLEEKPYKKITVRDLVDRCHVNRNTFYYHFEGIPDLMDHYMGHWCGEILRQTESSENPLLAILPAAKALKEHGAAVQHLADSPAWPDMLRHLETLCARISSRYIKAAAAGAAAGYDALVQDVSTLSEDDRNALVRFYSAVLYGCLISWLKAGMSYDLDADLTRISALIRQVSPGAQSRS